jgi:pyruvate/2-oxoglutarate dehydrogenase complex dihydrolipoamide acyltransferase (E2) component
MAASPILMPKLGLTMTEGLLAEWRVAPGDEVREGQVIFAVETDKITSEVEARGDGRIEAIRVAVGETVPVGAVVATWSGPALGAEEEDQQEDKTAEASSPSQPAPSAVAPASAASTPRREGQRIIATPYARKLAREAGIDLDPIEGTGPGGRIKATDVAAALQTGPTTQASAATAPSPGASSAIALAEVDCTAALALCERFAEAGEGIDLAGLLGRAVARTGHDITVVPETQSRSWLLPQANGTPATLALGPIQPQFRPDANGNPALRQIAPLALAADRSLDATDLLDGIVHSLENPLRLLL